MGRVHHIVGTEVMKRTAFPGGGASVDRRFQLVQQAYQPGGPRGGKSPPHDGVCTRGEPSALPDTYIYMASAVLIRKRVGWSEGGVVNYEGTRVELQGEAKRPPSGLLKTRQPIGGDQDVAAGRGRYTAFKHASKTELFRITTSLMGGRETVHLARGQ